MNKDKIYDTLDAMNFIKKKYPWIPIFIIRRVLFANDLYMVNVHIIDDYVPTLDWWSYKK